MITVTMDGLDRMHRRLAALDRQVQFAAARALTWTAKQIQADVREQMPQVFDRPTSYTLNAMYVRPATKTRLVAEVWHKDPAGAPGGPYEHYLLPEIEGGPRQQRPWERAILRGRSGYLLPAKGQPLDAYGNIGRGTLTKILSSLQRFTAAGFTANARSGSRQADDYVYLANRRVPGVYQRVATELDKAKYFASASLARRKRQRKGVYTGRSGLRLVLYQSSKQPHYAKRLPFYEIAHQTQREVFERFFQASLRDAYETAR